MLSLFLSAMRQRRQSHVVRATVADSFVELIKRKFGMFSKTS